MLRVIAKEDPISLVLCVETNYEYKIYKKYILIHTQKAI